MDDLFSSRLRPRLSKKLKLWHLSVAVLISALLLGGFRALTDFDSKAPWLMIVPMTILITSILGFVVILGVKLAGRVTWFILKRLGGQDGLAGILVAILSSLVYCVIVFGSLVIATVLTIAISVGSARFLIR